MALAQDIFPINGNLQDTLVEASKTPWIEHGPMSATKVLYTGAKTGSWAVLYRWKKGFVAPPHKHLAASHTFILKGKLKVRDGILNAGDYDYGCSYRTHAVVYTAPDRVLSPSCVRSRWQDSRLGQCSGMTP